MKRRIPLLLIFVMLLLFCACKKSDGETASNTYTPPNDVELVYVGLRGYEHGGIAPIIENKGSQVVKNIVIEVSCFDRNGYLINDNYFTFDYSTINLLPGESKILNNMYGVPDECRYVDGVISCVEYMDGSRWESDSVEAWFQNVKSGFNIEKWKTEIESMKDLAAKAISENQYMSIDLQGTT